jgi:geranylgeranyl diphosphate synthase type II
MDDDDLRRGRPTNHKVFGEAVALLAGDGLLTEAFAMMSSKGLAERIHPSLLLSAINMISNAVGYNGMVGGQVADIQTEGKSVNLSTIEFIHNNKTGAMITVSVASGVLLSGGNKDQIEAATVYGQKIGLAFQISDDILDIEGDTKSLGKQIGMDDLKGKNTYPSKIGLERSKISQAMLVEEAVKCLEIFDNRADPLRQIAHYIIERNK